MLWLDLEESGFESDGLRKLRLLRYAGEVRKYGDVYFDKVAEVTLPYPLERFYDPQIYCVYITFSQTSYEIVTDKLHEVTKMLIMKFGGASLADSENFNNVIDWILKQQESSCCSFSNEKCYERAHEMSLISHNKGSMKKFQNA